MTPYLIASWDYTAEGQRELSFKEGNRIKLLEKHNDDWWEGQSLGYGLRTNPEIDIAKGELDGTVGFFPANRTRPDTDESRVEQSKSTSSMPVFNSTAAIYTSQNETPSPLSEPSVLTHTAAHLGMPHGLAKHPTDPPQPPPHIPAAEIDERMLIDISTNDVEEEAMNDIANLAKDWMAAFDSKIGSDDLHASTDQKQPDEPCSTEVETIAGPLANMTIKKEKTEEDEEAIDLSTANVNDLELDRINPRSVREQGFVQIKMAADNVDCGKLGSWKMFYGVLLSGFLLLYKGSYTKNKQLVRPVIPVGSLDLTDCQVNPATKSDTRRKHTFTVTTRDKVKLLVQAEDNHDYASWLDAVMREMIGRTEDKKDYVLELLQHLAPELAYLEVNQMISYCTERLQSIETGDKESKRKSRLRNLWTLKPASEQPFVPNPARATSSGSTTVLATQEQIVLNAEIKNPIFGGYLHIDENGAIPLVVKMCIEEVEKRGMDTVGIYRLSGPAKTIEQYRTLINQGDAHVSFEDEPDINTVTGLLKRYFRELRDPLLTHEHFEDFIEAARMPDYDERMYALREIIHTLPPANYCVLEYLTRHLRRVSKNRAVNKMEATNLALIFSVGLLRPEKEDMSNIMNTNLQTRVIEAIIQLVDWFFEKDAPESGSSDEEDENNSV